MTLNRKLMLAATTAAILALVVLDPVSASPTDVTVLVRLEEGDDRFAGRIRW